MTVDTADIHPMVSLCSADMRCGAVFTDFVGLVVDDDDKQEVQGKQSIICSKVEPHLPCLWVELHAGAVRYLSEGVPEQWRS